MKKIITRCGKVTDVYITEKGYAFVTMADDVGAAAAIKELNGNNFNIIAALRVCSFKSSFDALSSWMNLMF